MKRQGPGATKRLFVAVELPSEIQAKLESLQQELKRFARDAKWVRIQGIHLTLKFLGYVETSKISAIQGALLLQTGMAPFTVQAGGCGFFPNSRRPSVLWVGVHADQLANLQRNVEEAMGKLGFPKETRPFSPHLTLARFRDPRGLIPLVQEAGKHQDDGFGQFAVREFVLYESILRPQGAEYHALQKFVLTTSGSS